MKIKAYELIDHGMENSQYFQGCGTSCTKFTDVWTGIGDSSKEAYEDAVGQAYMDIGDAADKLPKRPAGFTLRPRVPADSWDVCFYVSIRAVVVR